VSEPAADRIAPASPADGPSARELLRAVYGYAAFRGPQEEIIEHVARGGDAFVLMPTGSGKSLCYQLPALLRPGVGLVISPLIALMQDQVAALRQLGVRAAYLNSTLTPAEASRIESDARRGALDLLYIAPERLMSPRGLELVAALRLSLIAIDEAHCVSQWGHDFRPEYLDLGVLGERFPGVPRLALTATADEVTRRDILQRLRLPAARVFTTGFDRPNLYYAVTVKHNPRTQLLDFLRAQPTQSDPQPSGIVYCLSRRRVEETAEWLRDKGYPALPYHAGLDAGVRKQHQERFLREDGVVMVATIAFGMGIDKPDVRFVAHLDLPSSIEAYYQETGRAGRDGLPANLLLLYGLADVVMRRQLLQGSQADEAHRRIEQRKLDALLGYCETTRCRREVLLGYFGDRHPGGCGYCDNCLHPPQRFDGTLAAQKALSAVYRTGQQFGAAYVIDVLTGHTSERIERNGHHLLKTFGVGSDLDKASWHSVLRQLIAAGLLSVDVAGHGSILLGERSWAVLRGQETVELRRDTLAPRPDKGRRRDGKKAGRSGERAAAGGDGPDSQLFEALRNKRRELAQAQGVPPYIIFHDTTLHEMAQAHPRDLAALARISGVGKAKLERYGAAFLAVLCAQAAPAL
jgi:ATP-dependent DNA helicase RecQ